ncbi:SPOR domain-containing protein [Clostridium sp. SM-530-WT-3G]|uniref:SPOR domain-containing protein n=1 Tax=Clostridium sp. SM-530-WT-3G TaxID=2725303 RepID=UPI00145E3809|nr:SPOR domain-containing protein [Clostridium sp. SM-530-WT-3G]NME83800.1 SPOR domain-containing protein [Clostridium sp. SM-530-WT-3G]
MRYTRYEYKKSGNIRFLITVLVVAILSIGGGLYISSVLFGNKEDTQSTGVIDSSKELSAKVQANSIVVLQCGFYSKRENADALVSSIKQYCYPFITEDNGNYRVIAGIFNEEDAIKKIQQFKDNGIEVSKTTLTLKADNNEDQKIIEICDGFLRIMSKFEEKDVNSIKTDDFKKWCISILGSEGEYGEKLKSIVDYVQSMPEEINKSNNSEEEYKFYNIIKE